MAKLTMAFDIEGTLLDKKGILYPQVLDIFKKADFSKTNFILLTGGSYEIAKETVKQINAHLDGNDIYPWIAVNGGAQIYTPDGTLAFDKTLSKDLIEKAITTAKNIDSDAVFMYATANGNYVEKQNGTFNNIAMTVFKRKDSKKGCSAMALKDIEGTISGRELSEVLGELGEVKELYVVSLNHSKRSAILPELAKALENEATVFGGKYMAIPAATKIEALDFIIKRGRSMPKNLEDVVYFGDGLNDVDCLKACNISVARGEKACKEAKDVAKFSLDDLSSFADALYSGCYNNMQKEACAEK